MGFGYQIRKREVFGRGYFCGSFLLSGSSDLMGASIAPTGKLRASHGQPAFFGVPLIPAAILANRRVAAFLYFLVLPDLSIVPRNKLDFKLQWAFPCSYCARRHWVRSSPSASGWGWGEQGSDPKQRNQRPCWRDGHVDGAGNYGEMVKSGAWGGSTGAWEHSG